MVIVQMIITNLIGINSSPPSAAYMVSISSDNGLWPIRRQAIILTNAGLLSIGPLETNFSAISIKIQNVLSKKNAFENIVCELAVI